MKIWWEGTVHLSHMQVSYMNHLSCSFFSFWDGWNIHFRERWLTQCLVWCQGRRWGNPSNGPLQPASTTFAHLEIMIVDACDCDGDLRYVKTRSRLDDSHRGASENAAWKVKREMHKVNVKVKREMHKVKVKREMHNWDSQIDLQLGKWKERCRVGKILICN